MSLTAYTDEIRVQLGPEALAARLSPLCTGITRNGWGLHTAVTLKGLWAFTHLATGIAFGYPNSYRTAESLYLHLSTFLPGFPGHLAELISRPRGAICHPLWMEYVRGIARGDIPARPPHVPMIIREGA